MKKNGYYVTVTLTFDPRSPNSIGSEPFSENRVQIDVSFQLEFVHKKCRTDRHIHTHTDKLQ